MKYTIEIHEDALKDIKNATDWYEKQSKGLGDVYLKQVKSQVDILSTTPHIFAVRYNEARCMLIKKFPFMVHFIIDEDNAKVQIYAVIHTGRNPEVWKK